jgi:hypothetical protein
MTSPPYVGDSGGIEQYVYDSECDAKQAYVSFKSVESFQEGFLKPVLSQSARLLNPTGILVVQPLTAGHVQRARDVLEQG